MLASKPKRLLALFLTLVMLLGLLPTGVFAQGPADPEATQREKQIVDGGGVTYYKADGTTGSESDYAVKLTKMVEPTGTENRFTINLAVEAKQNIQELEMAPDAAVVLVLDSSGSMGVAYDAKSPLSQAKEAAAAFLKTYVEGAGNAQRKVAIVQFGTNAQTVLPWTEANAAADGTTVNQAAVQAVESMENGFPYYYCYKEETHECFFGADAVQEVRIEYTDMWDWESTDQDHMVGTCKICGHKGEWNWPEVSTFTHMHCVVCGEEVDHSSKAEHFNHSDTFNGPHTIMYDFGTTNMEGALMLARNLIMTGKKADGAIKGIDNVYVILLSDGEPQAYVVEGEHSYTQVMGFHGETLYEIVPETNIPVPGVAQEIKETGAKLFTLGYNLNDSFITAPNLYGTRVTDWLVNTVKVDKYYSARDGEELMLNFQGIAQFIKTMANAWIVTDPIPKDGYVTYASDNTFASQKYARWDEQNNQVVWDLKQMAPDSSDDTTFTYTLSYDVILHPEAAGFVQERAYPTNGQATLSYLMLEEGKNLDDMTPEEITDLLKTVNFDIPTVKGYLGKFDFMKYAAHKDSSSQDIPLSGAEFTLSNRADSNLDAIAGAIERNATSKSGAQNETPKGQVEFTSIPSGYTYTLSEKGEFTSDGKTYTPTDETWDMTVSYGEVTGGPGADGVRNTLKQEELPLTLTKTWQAPTTAEIKVDVYQKDAGAQGEGTKIATLTLNGSTCSSDSEAVQVTYTTSEAKQWVYTLTVDKYNLTTGGEYTYTVKEQALSGYTTTYSDDTLSITNTATGTTSVSVEKQWLPIDGQAMTDMPAVEVTLIGNTATDPNKTLGTATLSEGSLSHTWTEVPVYDAYGNPYTYTVSEAQGDYQQVGSVTGTGSVGDPFVITNTVLEGTVDIPVTKTWKDGGAAHRPSVTVELLQDGKSFDMTHTLTADNVDPDNANVWTYTFTGLPQYRVEGNQVHEYKYTVKELGAGELEGYTSTQNGDLGIINTRTEDVAITVTKEWDDGGNSFNHGEVTIDLYRNGQKLDSKETTDNKAVFEGLDRYDADGVEYAYTVVEPNVPANYTVSYDYGTGTNKVAFDNGAATVTNTLNENDETVSLTVNKVWQHPAGTTAPDVTFTVIQKDEDGGEVDPDFKSYTMEAGTTSYTFTGLPKYYYVDIPEVTDPGTGDVITPASVEQREYQYTVEEGTVDGYNSSAPDVEDGTWTFTNTITGKVELSVEKVWVSTESSYPQATITLQRQANGGAWEDVDTWTTSSNASHDWGQLAKYDANGQLYTYKVVEASVSGYSTAYAPANATYGEGTGKITVTNTQSQDQTGSLVATKTWNDDGNAEDLRTDITLHLWQKYNGGNDTDLGTVIIDATGNKTGGTYRGQVDVATTTDDQWTITFSQLEKIANVEGQVYRYEYYVTEDAVLNYTTSISGGKDITNTLAQGTTQVQLTKTWIDPQGTSHPSVTFTLTAETTDGTPVTSVTNPSWTFPQTVTLGFADGNIKPQNQGGTELTADGSTWYYTWTGLPTHTDNQEQIVYKVSEGQVAGYTSKKDVGNTFTNTIEQENLNFTGTKTWDMSALGSDDYLKPDAQPVRIALYYVNDSGELGQMVDGCLAQVQPVDNGDGTITASFAFNDLPRYDLSSGAEYKYTVREVEETTGQGGQKGYSAIENGGTITFQVSDGQGTYDYSYTVAYDEQDTENNGSYTGSTTQVTNTYGDPQYYFYKILANYTTRFSDNGQTIYTATGVNVTPDGKGYIALTPEQLAALTSGTVTADPDDYATHKVNDDDVTFDFVENGSNVSVTLDEVNHMYVITLNYERELHKLTVNYSFEGMQTPPSGFESVTTPDLGTADGDGNYSDPGCYTSGQSYTTDPKTGSIPNGYQLTKVFVNGEEKPASFTGGSFGTGDGFKDITVEYVYTRIPGTHPDITDRITVNKYDDGAPQKLITSSSATFGLYSDENCENQVRSYATSGGTVNIEASASGLGAGTYYLKEISAPAGYTLSDQVWKLTVTVTPKEEWYQSTWVNYNVYDITATLSGEPVTSIDVTDKLLKDDYVVEYYFEQNPDGDDYEKGKDRDGKTYPDEPGEIGYFDTVKAEDHYLTDVPDGYHHGHDEPASIEYDDENKVIKIYYDLDVPAGGLEGDKIWRGEETTAYVAVYQKVNGTLGAQPYQTPVKVGETNNHFAFANLPQYVGGKAATYEIYEVISDGQSGWSRVEYNSTAELGGKDYYVTRNGNNIVNTELTDITITKTFKGSLNGDISYPDSVQVQLVSDGKAVTTNAMGQAIGAEGVITIARDGSGGYEAIIENLPAYDADGNRITYEVVEVSGGKTYTDGQIITLDGVNYEVGIDGFAITNTVQRGTLTITKTFEGPDALGDDFTITVKEGDQVVKELKRADATITAGQYVWTVDQLPTKPVYTVSESGYEMTGWTLSTAESDTSDKRIDFAQQTTASAAFDNKYTRDMGYLVIEKTVTGLIADENVTYTFQVQGPQDYGENGAGTQNITIQGNGTQSITAIRVPTGSYTVTEAQANVSPLGKYTMNTSYTNGTVVVTQAHTEEAPAKVSVANAYTYHEPGAPDLDQITGSKVWSDDSNRDGLRPASITVQLFEDGNPIPNATAVVSTAADAGFTINYDGYRYDGEITVREVGYTDSEGVYHDGLPTGYASDSGTQANGYKVTNTHQPETYGTITVEKKWTNGSQQEVTLRLYADGKPVENAAVVLDGTVDAIETEAWKAAFPGTFYKYEQGKPIEYTVVEDDLGSRWSCTVEKTEVAGGAPNEIVGFQFTVSNTYYAPSPDYYKVTVNYYDQDGNKIAESFVSNRIREGLSWDFSDKERTTITVDGVTYTFDHAGGDPITGTNIRRNQVVDLHYVADEPDVDIPDDDPPQGGEPDVDIPDDDPPQGGEPDVDIPDDDPPQGGQPDDGVPQGDLPQTGTTADQMSVDAGGLLGLSAILAATGLAAVELGRRKEEEKN